MDKYFCGYIYIYMYVCIYIMYFFRNINYSIYNKFDNGHLVEATSAK